MFKTIFSKLVAMFIFVLAIAFIVTGVTLSYFLDEFLVEEKALALEKSCDTVYECLVDLSESYRNPIAKTFAQIELNSSLRMFEIYNKQSYIWFIDDTGHIRFSEPELPAEVMVALIDDTGYARLPAEEQYKKVMKQPDTVKEKGDFFGFFKNKAFARRGEWLTVEKSYRYVDVNGNSTMYGVYMHTSIPEVQSARWSVFRFYLLSVGTAILISIILVYAFSLRITRPLKEIRNAAKIISGGEFKKRLNINSQDEIGQLAQSFNQMVAALQNIEEMRRSFIANVSHELRTPMTSIRGFVEGILDGTIPPEKHGYYLTIVRNEADRLNRLVNNLLDLAKMEAGEMEINPRSTNINELVRICVIKLETLITNKSLQVEAVFEQEDMYASADVDAIERVLYNLVHNAIKFTPEEGKIIISTVTRKDLIEISVEDSGIGISQDEIDCIWDRFYKADKSRSSDKVGTGLGLAIVKNIMKEHKQDIWVESHPGKGTKFTFTLRRVEKPENNGNI